MTVFPDGSKERLHGHNYYVGIAVALKGIAFDQMVPFGPLKEATAALCQAWREHVLIAAKNPYYELVRDDGSEIEFRLCGQRYLLPRGDVLVFPVDNITVEALAAHFADLLIAELDRQDSGILRRDVVEGLEVRVTESPGQGAVCYRPLSDSRG